MRGGRLVRTALLALVPLVLLAGWLYLYTHSHAVDADEQSHTLSLLKDLKQLDSDWSTNVLRSHTDINPNYDALVVPLTRFADGLSQLRVRAAQLSPPVPVETVAELEQVIEEKAAAIDEFKAQNSLFKNSLRYVPTAHENIGDMLHDGSRACGATPIERRLEQRLDDLVHESLRHSALPDLEVEDALRRGIADLHRDLNSCPPSLRVPMLNLLSHLSNLLRLRSKQSELLRAITGLPVGARIDTLSASFTQRFNAELASQFVYQRLLLAYSAVALLLVSGASGLIWWGGLTERRRLRALVESKTRELTELATRDSLTEAFNRRHIADLLKRQQALHRRSGLPLCLALLDVDRFKSINDRFGHAAGDRVLQRFAEAARTTLREIDLLARWGGEEFLVVLPQTAPAAAEAALGRLQQALADAVFDDVDQALRVSFSGGLVEVHASESVDAAVARADQAMYRAKAAGRCRIVHG